MLLLLVNSGMITLIFQDKEETTKKSIFGLMLNILMSLAGGGIKNTPLIYFLVHCWAILHDWCAPSLWGLEMLKETGNNSRG